MSAFTYTLPSMAEAAKRIKEDIERRPLKGGQSPADKRYMVGALENIIEILEFCASFEKLIAKAAKHDVPWRAR